MHYTFYYIRIQVPHLTCNGPGYKHKKEKLSFESLSFYKNGI